MEVCTNINEHNEPGLETVHLSIIRPNISKHQHLTCEIQESEIRGGTCSTRVSLAQGNLPAMQCLRAPRHTPASRPRVSREGRASPGVQAVCRHVPELTSEVSVLSNSGKERESRRSKTSPQIQVVSAWIYLGLSDGQIWQTFLVTTRKEAPSPGPAPSKSSRPELSPSSRPRRTDDRHVGRTGADSAVSFHGCAPFPEGPVFSVPPAAVFSGF